MKAELAVIDTSVIIFWLWQPAPGDDPLKIKRKTLVVECLRDLDASGVQFVVPTPVISELYGGAPGEQHAATVMANFGGLRTESFGLDAAKATGKILAPALKLRGQDQSKTVMKYDALIAGIAHALEAKYLVTANSRDFDKYLSSVSSNVEVIAADQQPKSGQLRLLATKP